MSQHASVENPAAPPSSNWWGETPSWAAAVHSPTAAARQVLVDACGARGTFDRDGKPLDDIGLLQRARVFTHPDRHGGERAAWDQVDAAARVLGLLTSRAVD